MRAIKALWMFHHLVTIVGSASSGTSLSLFEKTSCITPAENPLSIDSSVNATSLTDCVRKCLQKYFGQRGCEIVPPCLGVVISEKVGISRICNFVLDFGGFPAADTSKCDLSEYSLTVYKRKVSCPPEWLLYRVTCYRSGQGVQMTYANAQLACQNEGASLAKPTTVEENVLLYNLTDQHSLWIGLTLAGSGSLYKWEDGCMLSVEKGIWYVGQPDNNFGQEDCVEIYSAHWNDIVCDAVKDYVCQKKAGED